MKVGLNNETESIYSVLSSTCLCIESKPCQFIVGFCSVHGTDRREYCASSVFFIAHIRILPQTTVRQPRIWMTQATVVPISGCTAMGSTPVPTVIG